MERPPQHLFPPRHEQEDTTPAAPGELELVRSFIALHEHTADDPHSLPPSPATIEWWLRRNGLLSAPEHAPGSDLAWAREVHEALRAKVLANMGPPMSEADARVLDDAAREAGLRVRFDADAPATITASATGVAAAIGRLLAIVALAEIDGRWRHFKECRNPTCRGVFYDRSKNHTGKWCSMEVCGNRMKVRAWRERHAAR